MVGHVSIRMVVLFDALAGFVGEAGDVAFFHVARHRLAAARAVVLDAGASVGQLDVGELAERDAQAVTVRGVQIGVAAGFLRGDFLLGCSAAF